MNDFSTTISKGSQVQLNSRVIITHHDNGFFTLTLSNYIKITTFMAEKTDIHAYIHKEYKIFYSKILKPGQELGIVDNIIFIPLGTYPHRPMDLLRIKPDIIDTVYLRKLDHSDPNSRLLYPPIYIGEVNIFQGYGMYIAEILYEEFLLYCPIEYLIPL